MVSVRSPWLLVIVLVSSLLNISAAPFDFGWQPVVEGIDFQEIKLQNPNNHIFVARMDRSKESLIIESSIAQGKINGGREGVSRMARRYDQALNYWGGSWGGRNQVVVAVNGSYVDTASGMADRGVVHSGWYAKRFFDMQNGSGFAWTMDRQAFIGECLSHPLDKQTVIELSSGASLVFEGINVRRAEDELIIYTSQYDQDSNTEDELHSGEVLVEMSSPAIIPAKGELSTGIVRAIYEGMGSTAIPFDHIVLSAHGEKWDALRNMVFVGAEIGVSHKIKSYDKDDCRTTLDGMDWAHTYASVGGAYYFLENGQINNYPDNGARDRHPRTAVAFNDAYIFFIVVDGRNPWVSEGMTIAELAQFTRDTLGATWGIAQDGGGSSSFVLNGEIMNNTYCNDFNCKNKVYMPLSVNSGQAAAQAQNTEASWFNQAPDQVQQAAPAGFAGNPRLEGYERPVVNGLMMVLVQPAERSARFTAGSTVSTAQTANLRLGPGTNYTLIATLEAQIGGVVLDHSGGLNGILAKGYHWWKVDFGQGQVGWVAEEMLATP